LFVLSGSLACKRATDDKSVNPSPPGPNPTTNVGSGAPRGPQVPPPFDLKTPPADASKTASGIIYKMVKPNASGTAIKRNDTVLVKYTGWRQGSGDTFFTSQGGGRAMPLNLAQSAPGFVEGLQLLRTGEKAVLWIPPDIGFKDPQPPPDQRDTRVYEFDVVEVQPAPPVPDDVGKPPDSAKTLKSGIKMESVRPGTGKETVRMYDNTTFSYTAWDLTGRMVDTTEARKQPKTLQPYHQASGMADMLTAMTEGERARFWVDAEKMLDGGRRPGNVDKGQLCYEIEIVKNVKAEHEPPPTPPDVAKPPADTKKTAKGVFYRMLAPGPGRDPRHPTENDTVKVNYTGWTTDGKMFDSSLLRAEPALFSLKGVVPGWTDGIPLMTTGDRMRFWIPVEMAYKGQPGKPAGMLVFDVELLEIVPQSGH
jgi:FKBP-type peptidyl-prolyl cis-trans isomerase